MKFEIELEPFEKLDKRLNRFEERLTLTKPIDQQALSDSFALVLTEDVRERFMSSPSTTTGGNVYGGVFWRQLSDSYLLKKPERVNGKVLIDTTRLMNSFKIDSPELISEFEDRFTYSFGTSVPYAEQLQKTWPIVVFHQELLIKIRDAYLKWAFETLEENFNG